MTAIYLLRHGEADYEPVRARQWPGSMADLAPLSPAGYEQATAAAERLTQVAASALVSSPFTRTMQTANIVSCRLGLRLGVEFDLHEWVPDDSFRWHAHAEVRAFLADFDSCGGEWPAGQRRPWEPLASVRARASAALRDATRRMPDDGALIAVCHEMVIRSLTGEPTTGTGQFRRIESDQLRS
ncbi:MAG: histidine phosphatase family protein [Streptosporangiaceae bacterium]